MDGARINPLFFRPPIYPGLPTWEVQTKVVILVWEEALIPVAFQRSWLGHVFSTFPQGAYFTALLRVLRDVPQMPCVLAA